MVSISGKIEITSRMQEYLREIGAGPKTTRDLVRAMHVSRNSVGYMIHRMNALGLVSTTRDLPAYRTPLIHTLTASYEDILTKVEVKAWRRDPITEPELCYATILRNAGMTGQQLIAQFQTVFGGSPARIKNIRRLAMRRGS